LASFTAPFDQSSELLARVAADALKEAQNHRLVGAFQPGIAETSHSVCDEFVPLVCRHREIHRYGSGYKGLQIGQRVQLFVVHIDYHASYHDRSRLPVSDSYPIGQCGSLIYHSILRYNQNSI